MNGWLSVLGLSVLGGVVAIGATSSRAYGQNDDEEDVVVAQPAFEIHPSNFDQWVFGNVGSRENGLERLNSMLMVRCAAIEQACRLTAEQRKKLELAGRGDIKRYVDRVETVREKFMLVRKDQQKFNEIWQDINPLQNRMNSSFFGEDSLLAKTVRGTLTPEQSAEFSALERERQTFRYRAKVELVITEIESTIPLTDEQRVKVVELIIESGPPPRRFGQLDFYYVLYRASQIPEAKWRQLLDESEYKALGKLLQQGKQMEQTLIQNGALEGKKNVPVKNAGQPANPEP